MSRCERFEREGLLRQEQGLPPDPHYAECPDCREAMRAYGVLTEALGRVGEDDAPPEGWEHAVRTAVREARGARRMRLPWRGWPWHGVAAAAVALVVLAVVLPRWSKDSPAPALTLRIEKSPSGQHRGPHAAPGDRLVLAADVGDARVATIRVYRDDLLVLACSDRPPCARSGRRLAAELVLAKRGSYQALLVTGVHLPRDAGTFEGDAAAAAHRGAVVVLAPEIEVQ